jgi:hypothetical protein
MSISMLSPVGARQRVASRAARHPHILIIKLGALGDLIRRWLRCRRSAGIITARGSLC